MHIATVKNKRGVIGPSIADRIEWAGEASLAVGTRLSHRHKAGELFNNSSNRASAAGNVY